MKDIAELLNVSESRVCQINTEVSHFVAPIPEKAGARVS